MCSKEKSKDCQETLFRNHVLNFLDLYPIASFLHWMFENHSDVMMDFMLDCRKDDIDEQEEESFPF